LKSTPTSVEIAPMDSSADFEFRAFPRSVMVLIKKTKIETTRKAEAYLRLQEVNWRSARLESRKRPLTGAFILLSK